MRIAVTALIALLGLLPAMARAEPEGIERWQKNHPEASRELGEWVRVHPEAAQKFFDWDGHHPERSKEFVSWTVHHPGDNLDVFVLSHRGWPMFDEIMEKHRPAAEAFMGWARRHGPAAEALMTHPRGLEWAGHNLYQGSWHLEHPRR